MPAAFLIAQTVIDPAPFTAWGILGILGFAIVVLCAILYKLFIAQRQAFETRDKLLTDFVDRHREGFERTMREVTTTLSVSQEKVGSTLTEGLHELRTTISRQQRRLDEVLLTGRVLDKVEQIKRRGGDIDDTVIEKVVRNVMQERRSDE